MKPKRIIAGLIAIATLAGAVWVAFTKRDLFLPGPRWVSLPLAVLIGLVGFGLMLWALTVWLM